MSVFCHADMYPHGLKSLSPDTTVEKTLQRLGSKFEMVPLPAEGSMYVKPAAVMYELDGECAVLQWWCHWFVEQQQAGRNGSGRGPRSSERHMCLHFSLLQQQQQLHPQTCPPADNQQHC